MVMSYFSNRRAKKRAAAHQRHLADQQNARAQGAYDRAIQHADWTRGLAGAQVGAILGKELVGHGPSSGGEEMINNPMFANTPKAGLLSMFVGDGKDADGNWLSGNQKINQLYRDQMRALPGQMQDARNATQTHFDNSTRLQDMAGDLQGDRLDFMARAQAYDNDQHRNFLANQAAADAAMAFNTTQGMVERRRAAMGLGNGGYDSLSAMNLAATRANMMNRTRHQAEAEGFRRYAQAIQAGQGLMGQAGSLLGRSSDAAQMGMAGLAGEQQLQALPLHSFLTSSNMNLGGAAAALNVLNRAGGLAGSGIAGVNAAVTGTGNAANMSAAAAQQQANVPTAFQELRETMAGISEMFSAAKGIPTG